MGFFDMFGGGNDVDKYLEDARRMMNEQYSPYQQAGQRALPQLENQYAQLLNNPASMQALLGQGFQQDPGYQYQLQEAMNEGNQAASAGGMLGTPGHQKQMMGVAQGLANQGYNDYWNRNQGLFGQGLSGTQGMFNTGFDATNNYAGGMGNLYGSQANLANARYQSGQDMLGSLLGAGIGAAGYALGGPAGGLAVNGLMGLGGQNPSAYQNAPLDWGGAGWLR